MSRRWKTPAGGSLNDATCRATVDASCDRVVIVDWPGANLPFDKATPKALLPDRLVNSTVGLDTTILAADAMRFAGNGSIWFAGIRG